MMRAERRADTRVSIVLHIDPRATPPRSHVMDRPDAGLEVYAIRGTQRTLEVELVSHRDAQPLDRTASCWSTRWSRTAICAWKTASAIDGTENGSGS